MPAMSNAIGHPNKERSGWSSFFAVVGAISILGGLILGLLRAATDEASGLLVCVGGIILGIQCLFLAFLVDVFTDIRGYLRKLAHQSRD